MKFSNMNTQNLVQIIKTVWWSWNLVPRLIRICKFNGIVHNFYFRMEISFSGKKIFEKFKIVCLKWNLVPGLIWISKILWWCSLFLFSTRNIFLGKIGPKNQNYLKRNLLPRLAQICRIQCLCSFFRFFTGNTLFGQVKSKNFKIVNLSWNLVLRLIRICRIR